MFKSYLSTPQWLDLAVVMRTCFIHIGFLLLESKMD
jgi:hypothetical protein